MKKGQRSLSEKKKKRTWFKRTKPDDIMLFSKIWFFRNVIQRAHLRHVNPTKMNAAQNRAV